MSLTTLWTRLRNLVELIVQPYHFVMSQKTRANRKNGTNLFKREKFQKTQNEIKESRINVETKRKEACL